MVYLLQLIVVKGIDFSTHFYKFDHSLTSIYNYEYSLDFKFLMLRLTKTTMKIYYNILGSLQALNGFRVIPRGGQLKAWLEYGAGITLTNLKWGENKRTDQCAN